MQIWLQCRISPGSNWFKCVTQILPHTGKQECYVCLCKMKVFHTHEKSDHDPLKAWDPDLKRHSMLYILWVYTVLCTRNLSGIQISFSALKIPCVCVCVCVCVWVSQCPKNPVCVCDSLSHVWLFATPWTIPCQAPLTMEFSRQEDWSGLAFSSPGDLPDPGTDSGLLHWPADSLPSEPQGMPLKFPVSHLFIPPSLHTQPPAAINILL